MKKKNIIISFIFIVIILIASVPTYQNWSYIRFWLGYRIVTSPEGARFVVNHIQVDLSDNSTRQDAEDIVQKVNGKIIGEIPRHQLYLIEVPSRTVEELDTLIAVLENLNDPRIESVVENIMLQFE